MDPVTPLLPGVEMIRKGSGIVVELDRDHVEHLQIRDRLVSSGKSYIRGRLCTVDLLALTSLDQLLFMLKILFTIFLQNKLP